MASLSFSTPRGPQSQLRGPQSQLRASLTAGKLRCLERSWGPSQISCRGNYHQSWQLSPIEGNVGWWHWRCIQVFSWLDSKRQCKTGFPKCHWSQLFLEIQRLRIPQFGQIIMDRIIFKWSLKHNELIKDSEWVTWLIHVKYAQRHLGHLHHLLLFRCVLAYW